MFAAMFLLVGCAVQNTGGVCPALDGEATKTVYVFRYSWHTGLLIKRDDLEEHISSELSQLPSNDYLEFGWGDDKYYPADKPGRLLALRAICWPTPSVMHVAGIDYPSSILAAKDSALIEVPMDNRAFQSLVYFLEASFDKRHPDTLHRVADGLRPESSFFKANGSFHLFRTCNTWTAQALKAASCPISPALVITSSTLLARTRAFGITLGNKFSE